MAKKQNQLEVPSALYCDASYLIAYFAQQDQSHKKALKIRYRFRGKPVKLITSWPIIGEAATILLYHYGYSHARALLQSVSAFEVLLPTALEYEESMTCFREFNQEHQFSLNDVLSYVIIKKRLKNMPILTFDRDFSSMGMTVFGL